MRHLLLGCSLLLTACSGVISESGGGDGDGDGPGRVGPDGRLVPDCEALPARVYQLSPSQFDRTVQELFPGFEGTPSAPFAHTFTRTEHQVGAPADRLQLPQVTVEGLLEAARAVAEHALGVPETVPECALEAPNDACLESFVKGWLGRAFRRPATTEEVDRYEALYRGAEGTWSSTEAATQVVTATLMDPDFLFRTELGDDTEDIASGDAIALTPHERASALSYFIADAPPDAELLAAAEAGELDTPEAVEVQARRLLDQPESAVGILRMLRDVLGYERVVDQSKDPELFPEWDQALADDLREETDRFLEHFLFEGDATLEALMTAEHSFVNARLAEHYGLERDDSLEPGEFVRVDFPTGERAGVLTHGSLMALMAKETQTRIVERGKFIRERILCQELPPPPANAPSIPERDPSASGRQQLETLTAPADCQQCHQAMNPLGFPFESFDAIGRFRTEDLGHTIDPSGAITGTANDDTTVADATELVAGLADTAEVSRCFSNHLREYATGTHGEVCGVHERFAESGDLRELVIDLVTDESFFLRIRGER